MSNDGNGTAPLAGIRVVEAAAQWAGPLSTRLLADLGAEVIKVEATVRPDPTRLHGPYPENRAGANHWEEGVSFSEVNFNKLGLTLDLGTPIGAAIFRRLVRVSDVVVENFTPRVMRNFGLDYEHLLEVNPALIMASVTGFGHSGPWTNYLAFGASMEPVTGLAHLTGYPDREPTRSGIPFTDIPTALHCAFSVLAALEHRAQTGRGQWIDCAMYEIGASFQAEALLDYFMNGRVRSRIGNRHHAWAPQGCYPCAGDNEWMVLSITSDGEWEALCGVIGRPDLAADPGLRDEAGRRARHDELDAAISAWTRERDQRQAMALLQEAGVPAGAVLNNKGSLFDPHLQARDFFTVVGFEGAAERIGVRPFPGLPFKMSGYKPQRRPNHQLGQHSRQLLTELLGMPVSEVDELEAQDVIGTVPLAEETRNLKGLSVPLSKMVEQGRVASYDEDYIQRLQQRWPDVRGTGESPM